MVSDLTDLTGYAFIAFTVKQKESLAPIMKIHEKICMKTLGKNRWAQLANKRSVAYDGKFVDLYDILQQMQEKTGYKEVIK
jgi:hypothetical protein